MSPLWRDEVGIFLAPRRIALARMKRGIRPARVAERDIVVDARDAHQWEAALSTLANCLEDPVWQGANARLILSDNWVRYGTVRWEAQLSDEAERREHARLCMSNIYGDVVAGWSITLSDTPPGLDQVACGMPAELLARARELLASRDLRLRSIQPHLVAAFNSWRDRLPRGGAWFVALEEGSLAAAHFTPTHWDCVRSVRIGPNWAVELERLQAFGRLSRNSSMNARVYVDAPASLRWQHATGPSQDVEWLGPEQEPVPDRFALLERIYA